MNLYQTKRAAITATSDAFRRELLALQEESERLDRIIADNTPGSDQPDDQTPDVERDTDT